MAKEEVGDLEKNLRTGRPMLSENTKYTRALLKYVDVCFLLGVGSRLTTVAERFIDLIYEMI